VLRARRYLGVCLCTLVSYETKATWKALRVRCWSLQRTFGIPGFIAVEPGGEGAVDVGAGADEEEDDEEEGLEFEDAEHCCRPVGGLGWWEFVSIVVGIGLARRRVCVFSGTG